MSIEEKFERANRHHQNGQLPEADTLYRRIIEIRSNHPGALHGLGVIAYQAKQYDSALNLIGKAAAENPRIAEFHYNLGLVRLALDNPRQAIAAFGRAINLKIDYADAYYNLGKIFKAQHRLDEAIENFKQAIQHQPQMAEAHYNLGNALKSRGSVEEAIASFKECIRLRPDFAAAHNNLGLVLKEQGHLADAVDCYSNAIGYQAGFAEAHWNRSLALLLKGDFAHGWQEYEWRFKRGRWPRYFFSRHTRPAWKGSPFEGHRLLVFAEQGAGDTLQFMRYLPQVKALGGTVIFEVMESLGGLLQGFGGIDELLVRNPNDNSTVTCDWCIPLLSLPGLFKSDIKTIPASTPYLYPDSAKAQFWQVRLGGEGFRVGIVWAGNPEHKNDHNRSCTLQHFIPLAEMEGIQLYGLQKGEPAQQVKTLPDRIEFTNLGNDFKDFSDTAGAIENLDLVISVDTAVAHLAGAMGKPVWVLLPFAPDWRWLMQREDSPWYPTMRLFRQTSAGNWDGVFKRLISALGNFRRDFKTSAIAN